MLADALAFVCVRVSLSFQKLRWQRYMGLLRTMYSGMQTRRYVSSNVITKTSASNLLAYVAQEGPSIASAVSRQRPSELRTLYIARCLINSTAHSTVCRTRSTVAYLAHELLRYGSHLCGALRLLHSLRRHGQCKGEAASLTVNVTRLCAEWSPVFSLWLLNFVKWPLR